MKCQSFSITKMIDLKESFFRLRENIKQPLKLLVAERGACLDHKEIVPFRQPLLFLYIPLYNNQAFSALFPLHHWKAPLLFLYVFSSYLQRSKDVHVQYHTKHLVHVNVGAFYLAETLKSLRKNIMFLLNCLYVI